MILTGVVIFTLASLASGLAQSEILLLGGRVGFAAVVPARHRTTPRLDVLGAVTVTAATGSFIYGMLNAGDTGWADLGTLPPIAAGASLMLVAAGVLIAGLFPGSQHLQRSRFLALRVRPTGITPRQQAAARAGGARWELPVPGGIRTRRLRMRTRVTTATAWGASP